MSQNFSYRSGSRSQFRKPRSYSTQPKRRQPKKAYINPALFVQEAKAREDVAYESIHDFADFDLHALIVRNVLAMGYQKPSPIQDQTIAESMSGKDIVGIADTGTGKTAAFAIPIVQRLISEPGSKAIVLAPTRELAEQIEQQFAAIAKGSGLVAALLIGGTSMSRQLGELKHNPQLIIGTPGRVKDHLNRGSLNLANCNITVLDEVDRMLDMGFVHDITHILSQTHELSQGFYFSATLDARVKGVIETFSRDPLHVSVKSGNTSENVDQNVVPHSVGDKLDKLHDILLDKSAAKVIIFDDTHRLVEKLSKELVARGFPAGSIHGGKSQPQRQRILKQFKANEVTILVATDVAARGLDVSDVTHVINYSLPQSYDDYVHRIGRTGRAGKIGYALTFVED